MLVLILGEVLLYAHAYNLNVHMSYSSVVSDTSTVSESCSILSWINGAVSTALNQQTPMCHVNLVHQQTTENTLNSL